MHKLIALLFVCGLIAGSAQAQNYVLFNGGISLDERLEAPTTGVRLTFFVRGGAFVAGVRVSVTDATGAELVNVVTEGPWLILDLPAGTYRVVAEAASGERQGATFEVNGTPREVGLMFSTIP